LLVGGDQRHLRPEAEHYNTVTCSLPAALVAVSYILTGIYSIRLVTKGRRRWLLGTIMAAYLCTILVVYLILSSLLIGEAFGLYI
jgi:hypothetical protein